MQRLIVDVSSLLWTGLLAGKDSENGREMAWPDEPEKKPVYINSAIYGADNAISSLIATMQRFNATPINLVFVEEGKSSKLLRQQVYQEYKAGRDRHPAAYEEFNKAKEIVLNQFLDLGSIKVHQDGIEADDVIAYLTQNIESRCTVISNDGDLLVLMGSNVDVARGEELNVNKYGPFPAHYITLYKALVGDSSDGYPGAKGFGPKAFLDLFCLYGEEGLDEFVTLIKDHRLEEIEPNVTELKSLQKVIDNMDTVYKCWDLARLYPELINTMRKPLQWKAGMVKPYDASKHDGRLRKFHQQVTLVHAGNYDQAMKGVVAHMYGSPYVGLDIETTRPQESDDWLDAKKKAAGKDEDDDRGDIDVFGQEFVSMGLTFGDNNQYTHYFTHRHLETPEHQNLASEKIAQAVELVPTTTPIVVHSAAFELSVLGREWGERWKNNGYHGFLPNIEDTKLLSTYMNENISSGLKKCSKTYLDYDQVNYAEVTKGRKMDQMTAAETLSYGSDDPICTAALFNFFTLFTEIERTRKVYKEVEIDAAYLGAEMFNRGTPVSLEKIQQMSKKDDVKYDADWKILRDYLLSIGWEGTVRPEFEPPLEPSDIKLAYEVLTGLPLKTQMRKLDKIAIAIRETDTIKLEDDKLVGLTDEQVRRCDLLANATESEDVLTINQLMKLYFNGEPQLDLDSPNQMRKLMYEHMKLPVRVRNKATDIMRSKGIYEGTSKTDELAIQYALKYDADEDLKKVLEAILTLRTVGTRRKLYYRPYQHVHHWKDNLVHAYFNQNQAVTKRYSCSSPNLQQLPKDGEGLEFREAFVGHKPGAIVIAPDISGQELRLQADFSRDENMLACYMGDNKKDIHTTIAAAATKFFKDKFAEPLSYDEFIAAMASVDEALAQLTEDFRKTAKNVNFAEAYDAQAKKIAEQLFILEEEAQAFLDAKRAMFPQFNEWKDTVRQQVKNLGYASTMLGGRRHLAEKVLSVDRYEASRADRQGPNFAIQGSGAEMLKLAMGEMWRRGIFFKYDACPVGPIHDQFVASVMLEDLYEFMIEINACMTRQYAKMIVPIVSDMSMGLNLGQQIKIKGQITPDKVLEVVKSLGLDPSRVRVPEAAIA